MSLCIVLACCFLGMAAHATPADARTRVIVTTDGETDDRCSMIRFLLYANEWDIQGLIHSSSKHHWKGNENVPGKTWTPAAWLDRQLDAYAEVYPNLKSHDPRYPSADDLRTNVYVGNITLEGEMDLVTAGSQRIVDVLLDPDESPVWLQAWGGPNTIARALKTIQEEHPGRVAEVSRKARIFLITEQDNTFKTYIRPQWPEIQVLRSGAPSFGVIAYRWQKQQPPELHPYFDGAWMASNILQGHGSLCAMYEARNGAFRSEGDTPAFLHVIPTGLRSEAHPSHGGWGGRFAYARNAWRSVDTEDSNPHSILRWAVDFQNDWAARADWCVKDFGDANHEPTVVLNHGRELSAGAGDVVSLDATKTTDPDGDALEFRWWFYREASTFSGAPTIKNDRKARATVTVPETFGGDDEMHFVCTVADKGDPPLSRFARVIVTTTP
jgi:hypothetical protein